jgi:S1-C subfamily serine protease
LLQVSAPVQPGNSGGPLLDDSGRVIGMVVGTVDALEVARTAGVPPQNLNFAVRGEQIRRFLDGARVHYRTGRANGSVRTEDIAARARGFTLVVECLR